MTQQIINVGASANDGLGSNLRTAFTYCNDNFSQLYSRVQTTPPATLIGVPGDEAGMYAYDEFYFYYCFANFDAVNPIWNKALTISEPGNYGNANVALYLDGSAGNIVPANSFFIFLNEVYFSKIIEIFFSIKYFFKFKHSCI